MIDDDESPFWTMEDGAEACEFEVAVFRLLKDGVLFVSGCHTENVTLSVNCSDLFAWACADAEPLPLCEVGPLYKAHAADPKWGSSKWCCRRRNMRPQRPIVRDMRAEGAWDDAMEALPHNPDAIAKPTPPGP